MTMTIEQALEQYWTRRVQVAAEIEKLTDSQWRLRDALRKSLDPIRASIVNSIEVRRWHSGICNDNCWHRGGKGSSSAESGWKPTTAEERSEWATVGWEYNTNSETFWYAKSKRLGPLLPYLHVLGAQFKNGPGVIDEAIVLWSYLRAEGVEISSIGRPTSDGCQLRLVRYARAQSAQGLVEGGWILGLRPARLVRTDRPEMARSWSPDNIPEGYIVQVAVDATSGILYE
jgi:hypothetical protein